MKNGTVAVLHRGQLPYSIPKTKRKPRREVLLRPYSCPRRTCRLFHPGVVGRRHAISNVLAGRGGPGRRTNRYRRRVGLFECSFSGFPNSGVYGPRLRTRPPTIGHRRRTGCTVVLVGWTVASGVTRQFYFRGQFPLPKVKSATFGNAFRVDVHMHTPSLLGGVGLPEYADVNVATHAKLVLLELKQTKMQRGRQRCRISR